MAKPTDDASNDDAAAQPIDRAAAFANLKTQFEAEENGETQPPKTADDGAADPADAEADDDNVEDDAANDDSGSEDNSDANDNGAASAQNDDQASDFKPRLTQFAGDGKQETYLKNLEDAYLASSQEGIKNKDLAEGAQKQVDAIKAAAAKDPEFGKQILKLLNEHNEEAAKGGAGGFSDQATQETTNPFLKNAETEWNAKNEESVKKFIEANPEVVTDPKINADVKRWSAVFAREAYEKEGKLITTGEAMDAAYRHLGLEAKRAEEQSLVDGMKKNAAPTRPQTAKKKSSSKKDTKQFSELTLDYAKKMGISEERLAKGSKR